VFTMFLTFFSRRRRRRRKESYKHSEIMFTMGNAKVA
jgi:hypothetical protein